VHVAERFHHSEFSEVSLISKFPPVIQAN